MKKRALLAGGSKPTLSQDLTKKLVIMVLVIFCFTSVFSLWLYSTESKQLYLKKHSEYLSYLNDNLELPLWNVNSEWVGIICESFTKNEIVSLLRVYNEFGEPLFEIVKEHEPSLIVTREPITYKGEMVGEIELGVTKRLYQRQNVQMLLRSILPMLFVIIGLMVASKIIFKRSLQTPLDHLLKRIGEISEGIYQEDSKNVQHYEIAKILEKFNYMAERIENREKKLIETNKKLETEIIERKGAQHAWLESEKRYQQLVEQLPVGVFRSSTEYDGKYIMVNTAFASMLGYKSKEELQAKEVKDNYLNPKMRKFFLKRIFAEGTLNGFEIEFRKQDGQQYLARVAARVVRDKIGNPKYIDGIVEDVTVLKNFERQVRQSQKMEAIGTLAGGIAHDFNNILATIFSFTEAAKIRYASGQNVEKYYDEILDAGLRARSLIKQMLAFSQQSEVERTHIFIGPIMKETIKFLRASLPAMIEIKSDFKVNDGAVLAAPTQIHQILMNLCTNSAHALKENGGILEIGLDEIEITVANLHEYSELPPGKYVKIDVTDNGTGIAPEVIDRIFEPFFTQKKRGEGTGMGLSVVHGIVNEMNGVVKVESQVGKGTSFHVLLPKVEGATKVKSSRNVAPGRGSGKVLLVDDEEGFISSGKEILEGLGYSVDTAKCGHDALELFENDPGGYDVVVTDLAMPKMTGFELAHKLKNTRQDIPVILCTGFSEGVDKKSKDLVGFSDIVMKPILAKELTDAIQRALKESKMI